MMEVTFTGAGDFDANQFAEDWLHTNGYSVGPSQDGAPRGILSGDAQIAKWRNLSAKDKAELEGTMTGDMRHGPVTIILKEAP